MAELSQEEAAELLGVSERTFRRWTRRYEEDGEAGLVDRRLGKTSGRRVPTDRAEEVERLYRERYRGFTVKHFHEHLVKDHGFGWGYTWLKLHLQWTGVVPKAPRKGAHRRKRERRPLPGMMLHQDGSRHEWLEGEAALDLIVTMDDATGAIYSAFLVEEEGTASTFRALKEVFSEHGLPMSLYTDRGAHYFHTPKAGGEIDRGHPTQVGRALAQLGVEHIGAYSPQARGRSERTFGTLQDRLVKELKLAGITDIEAANAYTRADGARVTAVDDVSLIVPEGEFVCLIGPSGCGKSTLLQMIAGLVGPSSGAIVVDGKEIDGPGRERGMVFQRDSVFPWMRVIDNVEYGLKCRGVAAGARGDIARDYLKRVGLSHVERAWPRELSGGMLKRVAIAAVFANGGEVLLLDEPFGALDYVTRRQLQEVLLDLWEEPGRAVPTVVFVTHDVDEALLLADRIVAMRSGAIVDDIPVEAARPRDTDTLLLPEMVAIKHKLLGHLGLAHPARATVSDRGAA